jgi:hypothetical protein
VKAWGPHPEIVDAAIAVLPAHDHARMIEILGDEARRTRFLVWMGDFGNQYINWNESWNGSNEPSSVEFYANDYLIFPLSPHLPEDQKRTFTPFFLRTLQALETETPANAARWLGSLLHFQTDEGAPPHAAGLSGEIHVKMESWVVAEAITISGYEPRLLGQNADEAVKGFERRMAGLIDFSKQRAQRVYPLIIAGDRTDAEPIILESANETARVTADLLHTLLFLLEPKSEGPGGGENLGELEASITASSVPGFESLPAKLMIVGGNYSTTSELITFDKGRYRGVFLLRNVRPGLYSVIVSRVGSRTLFVDKVAINSGSRVRCDWSLEPDAVAWNLVRNADFRIRWCGTDPDNWEFDKGAESWVSDNIKVYGGARYRLQAALRSEPGLGVKLQWYKNHWQPASDPIALPGGEKRAEMEITAPENAQYARLLIGTREDPAQAVIQVALVRL